LESLKTPEYLFAINDLCKRERILLLRLFIKSQACGREQIWPARWENILT
jgi:hypothetical protein